MVESDYGTAAVNSTGENFYDYPSGFRVSLDPPCDLAALR
jgi:hypothetical protein